MQTTHRVRSMWFVAVLGIVGCASAPAPEWLEGRHEGFPEDRWVVSVGAGPNDTEAAAQAREKITLDTQGESEGIGIAETWTDTTSGTHWAMAVLDRKALLDRLSSTRTAIDEELSATLARAAGAPPDQALAALTKARGLLATRDALHERLAHLGDRLPAADPDVAEVERRLASTRKRLPIEIESYEMHPTTGETADPIDGMRRALAQEVIDLGFPVSDANIGWGDTPTWLVVRSRLALERLQLHPTDQLVAVRWDAALEIRDPDSGGQLLAELTEDGRGTHLNEREARRTAQDAAIVFASAALREWLSAWIASAAAEID